MVLKPPVAFVSKSAACRRAAAGDVLINLPLRVDHAMKVSIAPRHFVEQRIGCDASARKVFA